MSKFKFSLGSQAEDTITGFSGMITSRSEVIHSVSRYYLQPKVGKDGKIVDGYYFDETSLRIIKEGTPTLPVFAFELGAKVKSTISGVKGTITHRSEHLNGCLRYVVDLKVNDDGKVPDSNWHAEGELELLKKKPVVDTKPGKGGPHSRNR